jgi:Xaa-Pro aminopeptidase
MTHQIPTALRRVCSEAKIDAFLISDLTNIRYLTGSSVSSGLVLIHAKSMEFFVDGRYIESSKETSYPYVTIRSHLEFTDALTLYRRVGFEAENVTVARLSRWMKKNPRTRFQQTTGIIENLRRTKTTHELRSIARACTVTKKVLRHIPALLTVGRTERALAQEIEAMSRSLGAESMAFDTIVAFGENTSRPHHHPTDRALQASDIVQIDMGVKIDGYCSDYSRVYWMGKKTPAQVKAYTALLSAKKSAEKLVKSGVSNRQLDISARTVLKRSGYDKEFCHSLGHGLGLDIHEMPSISKKAPLVTLRKHEVITIEPGLYFPGEWGMRVEDTIIVR